MVRISWPIHYQEDLLRRQSFNDVTLSGILLSCSKDVSFPFFHSGDSGIQIMCNFFLMIFTPLNETKNELKRKGERTSRYEVTTKCSCDSVGEHDGSDGHDDDDDGD